ncbi:hypothetical protein ACSVH2_10350 [Flavobacterium sp. RSB2_4_14]|uniref:hypothetical protein n=1 Tax=Flavobacterium sp. RSB2_4_14 TaxID=3447665 RepID=UPI003F2AF679
MKEFKLDKEPKINSGFNTPDGYFDSFSERILTQLPKDETKVISIYKTRKTWYFVAAAVLILMLSIPLYIKYQASTSEINSEILEDYLTYHSSITEDEIVNLLETEDLEKMKIDLKLKEEDLEEILLNNPELEQYLIN